MWKIYGIYPTIYRVSFTMHLHQPSFSAVKATLFLVEISKHGFQGKVWDQNRKQAGFKKSIAKLGNAPLHIKTRIKFHSFLGCLVFHVVAKHANMYLPLEPWHFVAPIAAGVSLMIHDYKIFLWIWPAVPLTRGLQHVLELEKIEGDQFLHLWISGKILSLYGGGITCTHGKATFWAML